MIEETGKMRFGTLEGEVINDCKIGMDSTVCFGHECDLYQKCYKDLDPDERGYIHFKIETSPL